MLVISTDERILPPEGSSRQQQAAFRDALRKQLRDFTDAGGTVLFEAACASGKANAWFRRECQAIWPEAKIVRLPRDHRVYTIGTPMDKKLPLQGIDLGDRTAVFLARLDLSCPWQEDTPAGPTNEDRGEEFKLGMNLCVYAMGNRSLSQWRDRAAEALDASAAENRAAE